LIDDHDLAQALAKRSPHNPTDQERTAPLTPANPAYVIYTSGSTGRPKGVVTRHKNAVNFLYHLRETYTVSPDDVVLQIPTLSFDASVRDLIGSLMSGAACILLPPDKSQLPNEILLLAARHGVTAVLSITPSLMQALAVEALSNAKQLPLVRIILSSGEALPLRSARDVKKAFPKANIFNQYGPTEATMTSSFWLIPDDATEFQYALCGQPIWNSQFYVLDAWLQPVPAGVPGELYIGGQGLA
nr:AMP-binding protein [Agrobacterium sp. rho-8.1]